MKSQYENRVPQHTRERRCRVCACTEREPCEPPCYWVGPDVCSACAEAIVSISKWKSAAHRANMAALMRAVDEYHNSAFVQLARRAMGAKR